MLSRLSIKNYALIDNLEISFNGDLNIITGETGAGKSIILGALSLILGQRADSKYFYNQQKKCVIEGYFDIKNYDLATFFLDNDLDNEEETVLRREISIDGKSRSFINDSPVNLNTLKSLGERLIDIHSQHATLEINNEEFQLLVVDAMAEHSDLLFTYKTNFANFKKNEKKLKQLIEESEKAKADTDYFQFLFDELESARIIVEEQSLLEQELDLLTHAEEIKTNLLSSNYLIKDGEVPALSQLKEALNQLQHLEKYNSSITSLSDRLKSAIIEIKDIADEIEIIEKETNFNENRSAEINDRLSIIYSLQKKHRVNSNVDLLNTQEEISSKLHKILFADDEILKLEKTIADLKIDMAKKSKLISSNRSKAIPLIEKYVGETLAEVGMNGAVLKINKETKEEVFNENGVDQIKFLFSANKGHHLNELNKVASGGELSRLMLSIKSLIAKKTSLPTIIFDEIDTGISGEVAHKVGVIMEKLSKNMQVVAITHLPQIASKGKAHYYVFKETLENFTYTRLKLLNNEERITEVAKMLSGENPKEAALQNAKELLAQ